VIQDSFGHRRSTVHEPNMGTRIRRVAALTRCCAGKKRGDQLRTPIGSTPNTHLLRVSAAPSDLSDGTHPRHTINTLIFSGWDTMILPLTMRQGAVKTACDERLR
jgi:hypothetical protein